uniref:Venom protein family 2 protein 13 n=1 Tax=Lethocerus distinctifemur TaxID=280095 RepID=A0A2K8JLI2_9HEMI|nr:venom protein family 2 protein 13 [Lethocerus distinctifemur]
MARTEAGLVLLAVLLVTVTGFQISDTETRPMPRGLFDKLVHAVDKVAHDAKDKVSGAVHEVTGTVDKVAHDAKDKVTGVVDKVSEKLMAEAEHLVERFKAMDICSCSKLQCKCCADPHNSSPDGGTCFAVNLVPAKLGVEYSLTLNGKKLLSGTASPRQIPAICVPVPYVPGLQVCLQPYDLQFNSSLHGCFRVEIKMATKTLISLALNCININKGGLVIEPPTEGPLKKVVPNIKVPLTKH